MAEHKITIEDAINNFKNLKDVYGRAEVNFSLIDIEKEYPKKIIDLFNKFPSFIYKK
jgi:3-methyladenine DNA glycosylase AlkC